MPVPDPNRSRPAPRPCRTRPRRSRAPAGTFPPLRFFPGCRWAPITSYTCRLALYRRYRPESFAEVIGQEHVTDPLQQALRNNRVNHAYLFSGPRGCGKTTSARILARC
ncbi:hypothetical protein STANM309S_04907 [Streptomyces tanashiensis]